MLHLVRVLICLVLLASGALADDASSVHVRVSAADPASGGRLSVRDTFYLKLSYRSTVPLRFQAEGYMGETKVEGKVMYNPAPVYPAGEHDAVVWISYVEPARIDEIRVAVFGADWKRVRSLSYPVAAEWIQGGAKRGRPAWAAQLSDRQQAIASDAMAKAAEGDNVMQGYWITLAAASIPGYFCLQLFMLFRYSGGWRLLAGLPLVGMIPLALYTLAALAMGSNLWPLMMLFLTPPAFLYLVGLLIVRLLVRSLAPS